MNNEKIYIRTFGWQKEFYEIRPKTAGEKHFEPYKYFYEKYTGVMQEVVGPKALWCRFKVNK